MRVMRALLVISIVVGGTLLAAGTTFAIPCPATIGEWTTCQDQDKIYTNLGTTLSGDTGLSISFLALPNGTDIHNITFDFTTLPGGGLDSGPAAFTIDYTIAIDPILAPDRVFDTVSIDTTVPGTAPDVTVTKNVVGTTHDVLLTSLSGNPDGPASVFGETLLTAHETFTIGANGVLFGATNIYTEVQVIPAPATLVMLGLGLTLLGLWRRH